ncbi:hypothetical protein QNI19_18560 [Cytophagaceae bacterium DM2B3-1]|uniref:Uncharacterized protein n=2 Tax=Xanthocytophaga TaxID=3078918 RepID=A0AAE3QY51_9BACT|nr:MULTISPECIES: hypothetical protein [Xanthocytophaga]MDJ1467574.1 hypothetical protein [Xanthocytophaga flavus]MDJ1484613.1 hypothetical protein [Xanthocytophaga flavus]MDJ1494947.1 hypothetical protein [Xanthocytophaga flavus]MDJ1499187.1 hypothetical protein [Xanthocytophaga agilis]
MKYLLLACVFCFTSCAVEYAPHCKPPKNKSAKALYKHPYSAGR